MEIIHFAQGFGFTDQGLSTFVGPHQIKGFALVVLNAIALRPSLESFQHNLGGRFKPLASNQLGSDLGRLFPLKRLIVVTNYNYFVVWMTALNVRHRFKVGPHQYLPLCPLWR